MRLPPQFNIPIQNLDSEEWVLGSCLLTPQTFGKVSSILEPEDFYRESHEKIYRAALSMHLREEPLDAVSLTDELGKRGDLEDAGGRARIHELAAIVPATANAPHHARIVRRCAEQRRFLGKLVEAAEAVHAGDLDQAERVIEEARATSENGLTVGSLHELLHELEEEFRNPPEVLPGIHSPFSCLGDLMPGRLYILGGYQGEGKTAMMAQFIRQAAMMPKKVGCFSIEMTMHDLRDRMVSSYGVPYAEVQARKLSSDFSRKAFKNALTEMAPWDVEINDASGITVAEIRKLQKLQGYEFICIDHLHRMDWTDRRDIEKIVRDLVNIAKDFKIPVLLLAQLKRPFGTDKAPRPTMSMLRESGMIEAEAAMVMFVYRARNDQGLRSTEAELIVAKNRFGEEGLHSLLFLGEQVRFIEPL